MSPSPPRPALIVSGGQTGVDRGALDAAIALGIPHGGWCPRGRRAEDGTIPERYHLRETLSRRYHVRTRQNLLDCDATLILARGDLAGGTQLTRRVAEELGRPLLVIDVGEPDACQKIRAWLARHRISVLNVAGPRESQAPGIAAQARQLLVDVFREPGGI